ncbi:related to DEG1 - pseudouridine synthase [Ustilago trichophora]|uniref:Related to DEG1 - pseudouridine synthase n=1 Tax=Ustilago trichophora TaxID=86804 RepID=A0A5C3ELX0_9BASI|nr:related to DEG1 - pseudouridine synthase [Ustilago trichophora]
MVNLQTTLRVLSTSRNPLATHSLRFLTTTHLCHRADTQLRIWQRKMEAKERYRDWNKESLLLRIAELEAQTTALRAVQAKKDTAAHVASLTPDSSTTNASTLIEEENAQDKHTGKEAKKKAKGGKKEKKPKEFDFATSPCRKIALRFSYDGAGYSGLAAQNTIGAGSGSTLPTVEAVLWDALCTARLVDPAMGMDGAGFSRCGRTDRGVSAAGQVVALWVRSKKVNQWRARISHTQQFSPSTTSSPLSKLSQEELDQLEAKQNTRLEPVELPYVAILNRILPTSIRIQAWSPVRSNFSSRFDCTYRHYKYFFPRGPPKLFFPPHIDSSTCSAASIDSGATRLDIESMRDAARRLLGEHDFRNLCKIDASKQITNYRRRIDGVSIDRVSSHWPTSSVVVEGEENEQEGEREEMYVLNLRGTAFLYHQVRNIMAILFLVGARLEKPNVIEELMNTEHGAIAADRVKMRLAATSAFRPTANSKLGNNDGSPVAQEQGEGAIKWWLPVNATSNSTCTSSSSTSSAIETPQGLPMWIQTTLNDDPSTHQTSDSSLEIYATKPNYEMAADRPLVLWECGFLPSDVEWRVGPYDGSLEKISAEEQNENLATASNSLLRVHKSWTQLAISTELTRHFILASPSAQKGTLPSRTTFEDASFPFLPTAPINNNSIAEELRQMENNNNKGQGKENIARGGVIPLGNGTGRGASNYVPLQQRAREETYEVKNQRWAQTTGKRRAERKEAESGVMIRDD